MSAAFFVADPAVNQDGSSWPLTVGSTHTGVATQARTWPVPRVTQSCSRHTAWPGQVVACSSRFCSPCTPRLLSRVATSPWRGRSTIGIPAWVRSATSVSRSRRLARWDRAFCRTWSNLPGLGCVAQGRHDLRVVVELDHGGGLVEGEQVGDLADGLGAGDGEVFVDGGLLDPGAADDRGGLHPEQGQLREPVGRLLAGHVGAMEVLDQLGDDALGVARLGQDADGNGAGGSADRDGAGGAPLALEDDQVPLLVAVDGDDLGDAVGLDAGQELPVQPRVDPDVGTDDELGGVDVQDPVRVIGGGLDTGRVAARVSRRCRRRRRAARLPAQPAPPRPPRVRRRARRRCWTPG